MFSLLLLFSAVAGQTSRTANPRFVSSGIDDIDQMRHAVASSRTKVGNARARLAVLFSWSRLLMNQGFDMEGFVQARENISRFDTGTNKFETSDESSAAIDAGFAALETIQAKPLRIVEKRGVPAIPAMLAPTDWPLFHANAAQDGYTADPGPSEGKLAWRFPIGHAWYSRPLVENGRVYVAAPGTTTLAYCLDESTGRMIWKARQDEFATYGAVRIASAIVSLKDKIVVREVGSGGEDRSCHVLYLNKQNGKLINKVVAGHIDYRRSFAPVAANERYLAVPRGYQQIGNRPPLVWMLNTLVLKETGTAKTLWTLRVGDIFGDPVLDGDRVYVAADPGDLYALNATGENRVAWQFRANAALHGTPAVFGNAVYIGANDGNLYAIHRETGRLLWSYNAKPLQPRAFQFYSTATQSNGFVYVGTAGGRLYCLDAQTGRPVWEKALPDWVRSRPLVIGNAVYAASMDGTVTAIRAGAAGGQVLWQNKVGTHQILADLVGTPTGLLVSSSDLYLNSLNPATGKLQWRQSLLESAFIDGQRYTADYMAGGADYQSSPTVVQGRVFVGGPDHFVHAMDASTGRELWRFETSAQVSGTPIYAGGRVYFGQQGGDKDFYAVDAKDGTLLWKRPLGWAWVGAGYSEGKLYVGTVEGEVHCVRAATGEILWTHKTNGGIYPSPATDTNAVYTGSWDGHFFALDKKNGAIRWAYYLGGSPDSAAAVLSNGRLLIQSRFTHLASLDAQTGNRIWDFPVAPPYVGNATPAVHDGRVYVSTHMERGEVAPKLFALDETTGKEIWRYRGAGGLTGASIARNRVFVGASEQVFFTCLDAKGNGDGTTQVVWRHKLGGIIDESCPAIYGRRAYVLASDRYLYAFE